MTITHWDDAHEVESTETDEITYSSHFPKPEWLK